MLRVQRVGPGQVLQHLLTPRKAQASPHTLLWEVEASLFQRPSPKGKEPCAELFSPYLCTGGLKYRVLLKLGEGMTPLQLPIFNVPGVFRCPVL